MSMWGDVSIIDTMEGFTGLAKPWNNLLRESRSNTQFLTWEWLHIWAECYVKPDRRLFIILLYDGSKLIGVAPWCVRHFRYGYLPMKRVEFLGVPEAASDYLDVFAKRGRERDVASQLYEFLNKSTELWDSIELQGISSESLFLLHFMNRMEKDGKGLQCHPSSFCPSVSLTQSVEAFRAQLSSNRRQQHARHLRLLQREGDVQHYTYRRADAQANLERFWPICEQRWGASDRLVHFIRQLLARGTEVVSPELDLLTVDGQCVAGLLHFRYGDTMSMYVMGVDHFFDKGISIGNILVGLAIERSINEGCKSYDFLRGDEPYKFHWSNQGRRTMNLVWYGKKAAPMLQMINEFAKSFTKMLAR